MLIVFAGLPGTGKTTLARRIARERGAVYLRIDTIEEALQKSEPSSKEIGSEGYDVAYAVAADNVTLGQDVVADSVNALEITRDAWRRMAATAGTTIVEIEVMCSDTREHRRRIEMRSANSGASPLTWQTVIARKYEPYDRPHIVVDTHCTVSQAFEVIRAQVEDASRSSM